jgi:trans-2,3-dihydro-3-hydroxyanthranilate isomerase
MQQPHSYRYLVVDVFTQTPLEGNALAVFPDSRGLSDGAMQRIARELNLSETVFVEDATLAECVKSLRIFTPSREMPFAGHPTVGGAYILLREGLVAKHTPRFSVQEKIGPVAIRVEAGDAPMIWLETPAIHWEAAFSPAVCAEAVGLELRDLLPPPPQIVNAGNPTLFVAVRDQQAVDRAWLDTAGFAMLKSGYPAPFCLFVFAPVRGGAYSRMFAPEYGIVEDPATGSSTGPLGAFMKRHHLLGPATSGRFVSEQGTKMGRRSLLHFEITAGAEADRILVGGHVTPLVEAVMTL